MTDRQTERTRISAVPPKTNKPNDSLFHYTSLHVETSPSLGAYDPQRSIHTASNRQIDSLLHLTFDESRSTYMYIRSLAGVRTLIKQHLTIFAHSSNPPGNPIEVTPAVKPHSAASPTSSFRDQASRESLSYRKRVFIFLFVRYYNTTDYVPDDFTLREWSFAPFKSFVRFTYISFHPPPPFSFFFSSPRDQKKNIPMNLCLIFPSSADI